jgi:hypothetical protein
VICLFFLVDYFLSSIYIVGLHTCGPLAPSMLRLFVKDSSVKALCGVGCCYQQMEECFLPLSSMTCVFLFYLTFFFLDSVDIKTFRFPLNQ